MADLPGLRESFERGEPVRATHMPSDFGELLSVTIRLRDGARQVGSPYDNEPGVDWAGLFEADEVVDDG